jgi:hypothetical protein
MTHSEARGATTRLMAGTAMTPSSAGVERTCVRTARTTVAVSEPSRL